MIGTASRERARTLSLLLRIDHLGCKTVRYSISSPEDYPRCVPTARSTKHKACSLYLL